MRVPVIVALFLGLGLAAGPAIGQESGEGLFFDTVEVRVVNVEVIVTDKNGLPVTGLTRDDFELFEDRRLVEITNFFAVENRQVQAPSGGPVAPEDLLIAPETRRLQLVVFVDNFNMRPENRNAVFAELKKYLGERLDPRDRVMLVTMNDRIEVPLPFTNDPGLLLAELERLEEEEGSHVRVDVEQRMLLQRIQRAALMDNPVVSGGLPSKFWEVAATEADRLARDVERLAEVRLQRVRATVAALTRFTHSLAGMEGRKALLYVSDGLPLRPADALAQAWLNKFEFWIQDQQVDDLRSVLLEMTALVGGLRYDASSAFEDLVDHAGANRVVFYPLANARGLMRSQVSAEVMGSGTTSGRGAMSPDVVALETLSLEGSLLELAEGTGGMAFTRTLNVDGLLERVANDFATFYSLGYSPQHDEARELHEIEVKVEGKGLKVRHLGTYRERDPLEHLQDLTLSALHYGLENNVLEVRLDPGEAVRSKGKRFRQPIMVQIPFQNLLLLPQEEMHIGQVTLYVAVLDAESGGVSDPQRIDLPIEVPNSQVAEISRQAAAYPLELDLEKGAKRIAVGVRDRLARVDATINLELTVGEQAEVPTPAPGS
jgi:VWFA-related protein